MSYYSEAREYHDIGKYEEAYKLYVQGANEGDEKCYYGIALFLHEGYYVEEDKDAAEKIFAEHFGAILSLSKSGDAEAIFIVACYYYNGFYVQKNSIIAFKWLKRSAQFGYSKGQSCLAHFYKYGTGCRANIKKAVKWYEKAIAQGDITSKIALADMYIEGESVKSNYKKAIQLYESAAEQGNAEAQVLLGYEYLRDDTNGSYKNIKKAIELFKKSADQNYYLGLFAMGCVYQEGLGVPKNEKKAFEYYKQAAEQNDEVSLWRLGECYRVGIGVEKNAFEAEKYYLKAIKLDDTEPLFQASLAHLYLHNEHDYEKALQWYQEAAKLKSADAICNLGYMYENGLGVDINHKLSFELYKQSANLGNIVGMNNVGWAYENGIGVEVDGEKAVDWYAKASNYADEASCFGKISLARMYIDGIYVQQNVVYAIELLEKARALGNVNAANILAKLYYDGDYVPRDNRKAFEILSEIPDNSEDGEHHFYLGQCYHSCRGVDYDVNDELTKKERLIKAKEHYKKAIKYGINCKLSLVMVEHELGERGNGGATREYAFRLLREDVKKQDLLRQVESDLEKDFGKYWGMLKNNAKQALISGIFYYVMNVSCGEEVCKNMDFTNVVSTLSKALEIELSEFFGKGYIEFLRDIKKIPAYNFDPDKYRFVMYTNRPYETKYEFDSEKNEKIYVTKRQGGICYCDARKNYGFSLGALTYLLEIKEASSVSSPPKEDISKKGPQLKINENRQVTHTKCKKIMNPYMQEYIRILFRQDAFDAHDFDNMAIEYLIGLERNVNSIRDIRNSADHTVVINSINAEYCSDILVKTDGYRILCELLDKISPEYIQKSLESPIKIMDNKTL